jgi:outer membrane protein TolC
MRWKPLWVTLTLIVAVTAGCKQRCFMTEADWNRTTTTVLDHQEEAPSLSAEPLIQPCQSPPTLGDLDRKVHFISLAECIAMSLEHGRIGQPSLLFPGTAQDNLIQFTGRGVTGSDALRVLALDPARAGADIEASLSKFDAVVTSSIQWQTTDTPIGTSLQTFQAGGLNSNNTQSATGSLALIKPLGTGGVAGITFNLPYTFTNLPARVNPAYQPQLLFQFEQPLMQGFGVEINQLRASHPGSLLNPGVFNGATSQEGILITRIRFDQQRAEFERVVNQMLLNVEVAYWNLYGSYWTLYSREQGLRFAYGAYKLTKANFEAGRKDAGEFYKSRGQYEQFRAQRLQAIDQVLENERQLRALIGIPIEDGTRLMPSDAPTLAPYNPDWMSAQIDALTKRPELYMARQDIKAAQMNLLLAKNQLLPDVRLTASYDINSLGTRLDGASGVGPNNSDINALRGLSDNKFNSWTAGIRANIPLGFRFGHTQVRQAQIALSRSMETLKDQELKAQSFLYNYYKRLSTAYEQIKANRATREAFAVELNARRASYIAGRTTIEVVLEAQRFWADALANEYQAVVAYNNALVGFEFAKGTILQHDNVVIAEGQLPGCASVRAVEHEKQRTAALVLRQRAMPAGPACAGAGVVPADGQIPVAPPMPEAVGKAPSLPAILANSPPLKEVPALPAVPTATDVKAPVQANVDEVFSGTTSRSPATMRPPVKTQPVDAPLLPAAGSTYGPRY